MNAEDKRLKGAGVKGYENYVKKEKGCEKT